MTDRIETVEDFLDLIARRATNNHYRREGVNLQTLSEDIMHIHSSGAWAHPTKAKKPLISKTHMFLIAVLLGLLALTPLAVSAVRVTPIHPDCTTERC